MSTGRGTLRDLTGVEVVIEPLPIEVTHAGLSAEALRSSLERQLDAAHVTVYASQKANLSPAQAYLDVHVNAVKMEGGARHAIAVQLQLRQTLQSLVTGSRIVDAMTWDAHNVLVTEASPVSDLTAELRGYVDLFIDDWAGGPLAGPITVTSATSTALAGTIPGTPRSPYARCGAISRRLVPPTRIPSTP